MRIVDRLLIEHDPLFVLRAAVMCSVGSAVTVGLFRRSFLSEGLRSHAGSS